MFVKYASGSTLSHGEALDMPPCRILGACNPQFAHQALQAEPQIGALLPCNVVAHNDAKGHVIVEIMDPAAVLGLVERPEMGPTSAWSACYRESRTVPVTDP